MNKDAEMETVLFLGGDGLTLKADVGGDPTDPPVLFLHGGGQTRSSWRNAARALVAAGRYVVSLDLRGHGESAWAEDGNYSLDAYVRDLRAVVSQLPSRPAIVGASLGGLVALTAIGESYEPLATALVLVDVTPKMNMDGVDRILRFMRANPEGFETLEQAAEAISRYLPHRPTPPSLDGLRKNLRRAPSGRFVWHWDPGFLADNQLDPERLEGRYAAAARNIRVPTLLVRGALSEIVDDASIDHFRAQFPMAEFANIAGATHMVAGDKNDAFNVSVLSFLERTIRRSDDRQPEGGVDPKTLRSAMSCFATGVTVITTRSHDGTPLGFTANSFTSVSLSPPLVLFCAKKESATLKELRQAGKFAVNVLHIGQQEISNRFARSGERFVDDAWSCWDGGLPILNNALANFQCDLEEIFEGGDHDILIGRVVRVQFDPARDPLLFLQGGYRRVHIPTGPDREDDVRQITSA